jgi:Kef-type K+ transport system membrane component KefB
MARQPILNDICTAFVGMGMTIFATTSLDTSFGRLLASIAIIGLLAKLAGLALRRLGQPAVIGEILVGIALGPSLLGVIKPGLPEQLFPTSIVPSLKMVSEIGLVLFMFTVGMEVDVKSMRRSGRHAAVISLTSIAVPFALGCAVLAPLLFHAHKYVNGKAIPFTPFALFIGVSMCGTAFAVLARVLAEQRMLATPLGNLLMSCAAIDDVVAFALLGLVVAIATSGGSLAVGLALVQVTVLILVLRFAVRPLMHRYITGPFQRTGNLPAEHLGVLVLLAFASAFVTLRCGLHPMMGAFLCGTLIPQDAKRSLVHTVTERLEGVSVQLLMPVFFVVTGLGVNITGLGRGNIIPTLAIFFVACLGKFAGGAGAARLLGRSNRESLAIGTMMNTRGLAELVILSVGRSAGILDDAMFTMLVVMAVATTVMAGPIMKVVYPQRLRGVAGSRSGVPGTTAAGPIAA